MRSIRQESCNKFILNIILLLSFRISNYEILKENFIKYFSSYDNSLMKDITNYFRECDETSTFIKEKLSDNLVN